MARKLYAIKADLVDWANNQIAKKEKELKNEILESKILESLFMELKDYIKNPGESIYYHVFEEINEINNNNKSIYEYCVLCDCGSANILLDSGKTIVENRLSLKEGNIEGKYYDPDMYSLLLYLLTAHKFSRKLENKNFGIDSFKVSQRDTNKSCYCINAFLDEEHKEKCKKKYPKGYIQLGGDWVVSSDASKKDSWTFFNRKMLKENQNDLAKMTHTIMGHPVWPCTKIEGKTINQARGSNISIHDTLDILKKCWEEDFKLENAKGLERAFCLNDKWFKLFENFNNYIEFWDLERFSEKKITLENINEIFRK